MLLKIRNIILYLFGIFIFQEIIFRWAYPIPEIENFDRVNYTYLKYDARGISHNRNKTRLWQSKPDTTHIFEHKMNSYAFRDREWKIKKSQNKRRILFIGDSFIEGIMAEQNETIPEYFNKSSNYSFEVFNGGMVGCGLSSYLQLAADAVPIFKPDITFLCIYANDLGKTTPITPEFYLAPEYFNPYTPRLLEFFKQQKKYGPLNFRLNKKKESYFFPAPHQLNPWTHLNDSLQKEVTPKLASFMKKATFNPFLSNALWKEEKYLKKNPSLGESIPFFKYTCDTHGSKPIVIYIPSRNQITSYYIPFEKEYCIKECSNFIDLTQEKYQLHQKIIRQQCKRFNVPFIDLTSSIKNQESNGNHLYWDYDQHMRAKGYQFVGETLWNTIGKKL